MRPNVLWIQSDEHRPDSLGCYGSAWARTPNLDALASRGTVFLNAVCQSPVCVPSRASQLAARYPQEINTLFNDVCEASLSTEGRADEKILPAGTVLFPEWAAAGADYQTATFGKSHLPPCSPWQTEHLVVNNEDYAGYYALNPKFEEDQFHVLKRPGSAPIIIGGTYPGGSDNPSRRITDEAIAWLSDERDESRPFLLRVSHNWPHTPVLAPEPFDLLYESTALPVRYFDEHAYQTRARWDRGVADNHRMRELSPEQMQQQWVAYMGLCAYVDHEVGRLLGSLEGCGLAEETIVVFSADHGKALGEWGATEKGFFDSEVWRVPFIWSWPGRVPEGLRRAEPCELIDTARTLAGLMGIDPVSHWRGRDLFGGGEEPGEVFGQIGWPSAEVPFRTNGRGAHWDCMRVAVRTARFRLDETWMEGGARLTPEDADGNLFDLEQDPLERTNRWSDPSYGPVVAELRERLERWWQSLDRPVRTFPAAS